MYLWFLQIYAILFSLTLVIPIKLKKNAKIGNSIIYLDQTDSTNNYIAKLVNEGKVEFGQVILADEQFEGRGQRDAKWLSEIGKNLLLLI